MPRSAPRTKIAAVGTLAALGALAAVATASNSAQQKRHAPVPIAAVRPAAPKTVVVHRTVGVLTRFVPARVSSPATAAGTTAAAKHKAAPVATPAVAEPSTPAAAPKPEPKTSSETDTTDLPEPGVTEDECLPVTVGGAPQDATAAGAPATVALASTSSVDRRAARRAARRAHRRALRRAQRRAHRRALRRAQRRALRSTRGGRPLRTSHPLPEDAPGGVVDGCGLAPVPGASDATTAAPVAVAPTVSAP